MYTNCPLCNDNQTIKIYKCWFVYGICVCISVYIVYVYCGILHYGCCVCECKRVWGCLRRGDPWVSSSSSILFKSGFLHCLPPVHLTPGVTTHHHTVETVGLQTGQLSPLAFRGCWAFKFRPCPCTDSTLPSEAFPYPPNQIRARPRARQTWDCRRRTRLLPSPHRLRAKCSQQWLVFPSDTKSGSADPGPIHVRSWMCKQMPMITK